MLPFTKRNVRSEDDQDELLETGEIEVVQTELRAAVEGARPQVRAKTEQQYGQRRASVRKIGSQGSPAGGPASGPQSQAPAQSQRYHSSIGGSVSLGAINEALGAMNTEPAFADRDERPVAPQPRAIVRTPAPAPSPLLAPPSRASTRLPSPTAAMSPGAPPPASPTHVRRDEDATIARPLSSPPPPPVIAARAARVSPPAGGIAVPTPLDELEQTNAVMPLSMPAMDAVTDEVFANPPSPAAPTAFQLQTPPTIMAGGAAMSTEFRAQVLQQMQAARAGQAQTAMDQLIAQQLSNVQRAQPIPDPSSPAVTQLSAQAVPAQALTDVAGAASPVGVAATSPMPGAIRPPGTPLSTSNVDPPGTAVTARTKVRFGNPAMSWTAGLLVVGACVGAAVFVMWRNDSRAEAAAQAARSVQAAAAAQQAQMASTGTYLGQNGLPATPEAAAVPAANPQAAAQAAPYGGLPATGAAGNVAAPSASTTAAAAALTAAALNNGTTGMGGTLAPGNGSQPVMALTPAQLAVMTGGAPAAAAAPPAAVAAAPAAAPAAAAPASGGAADDGSHHHHHAAAVAANDTPAPAPRPAPVPRAAAPAPAPKPAPAPVAKKAAPAGSDDMDSAAKALAKAQLEQSL